jgi:hypothetical protein
MIVPDLGLGLDEDPDSEKSYEQCSVMFDSKKNYFEAKLTCLY